MRTRSARRVRWWWPGGAASCAALITGGCSQPSMQASLNSDVPQERIMGLAESMNAHDQAAVPEYITMLGSDDPAVRMFAIVALRDLTGETFGYDYGAPEANRQAAIRLWEQWLSTRETGSGAKETAGL